jgi:hypothetical protein
VELFATQKINSRFQVLLSRSFKGTDSLTVVSDKTGAFKFENIADTGTYNLVITYLGYESNKERDRLGKRF